MAEGKSVLEAAGAKEVWFGPPGRMHLMGGTVMGRSVADSVTNDIGQVHGMSNLVAAGPGLFASSVGVNPTFTVHALTMRAVCKLLSDWKGAVG